MGHTRLGSIPKSKKWSTVVRSLTGAAGSESSSSSSSRLKINIDEVARQTLDAAQGGLTASINDPGLVYTFFTLAQIVLAARQEDFRQSLAKIGISVPEEASLQDLTTAMQSAIDDFLYSQNKVTDISEIAQKAAGEALTALAHDKSSTLFGSGLEEVRTAVRDLSTKKGFSDLGQKFFGLFIARFLNFYLSRVSAATINGYSFSQLGDITKFNVTLKAHCEQSAFIVRDFCGEWYSKTEYLEGINLKNTSGFIAVALKKLRAEMKQQNVDQ
jgi:hypothetical protein